MSSPVPTPPLPPPSPSPPTSQLLLGNFELPSDLEWSTKKRRTSTRGRRIPKRSNLDFLLGKSSKPCSDYSSRALSPKLDVHNARDSSSSLRIGPSNSTAGVPSSCHPKPPTKPRSTSSKVHESKDKNVKVDREGKQSSQEKKKKGKGDEKERKNEKKMKEKEPNQERRAESKLPTFSRQLSFEEIADDISIMTGTRASRNPKKRPTSVQRQVDRVTPGLRLGSIKRNRYKVDKDIKKGKQGLEFEEHHPESE